MRYPVRQMIESSPALISTTSAYTDNFILTCNGVLNIYYDLTEEDCDLILSRNILCLIQFAGEEPNNETLQLINSKLLAGNPAVFLRVVLNGHGVFNNLDFLIHLPALKGLTADMFRNDEVDKINKYLRLNTLSIVTEGVSLKGLIRHTTLKNLSIGGKPKNVEFIGQMDWLENLSFANQTFKSLSFLESLKNLRELHFMLGGTKNLAALPQVGKIQKLSFTRIRMLVIENLLPVNEMIHLKELILDELPHLTDLRWLSKKNVVTRVINCKNYKA